MWRCVILALFLLGFAGASGCAGSPARDAASVASFGRLDAVHAAGDRYAGDPNVPAKVLKGLVEALDNDDRAVRMMAIQALQRITGTRHGFDPYAPRHVRETAVRRWWDHVYAMPPDRPSGGQGV